MNLKKDHFQSICIQYLGNIRKSSEWIITFGISPKGLIHMWLGDMIKEINDPNDIGLFIKHYFRPDNLGKHFVKTQIKAEFVSDEDPNE